MNDLKKSLVYRFLLGFGLGMLIGAVFLLLSGGIGNSGEKMELWAVLRCLAFCGLYGSASVCGMILYKIDSISLVSATAVHFLIVIAGLFLLGLSLGWQFDQAFVLIVLISYVFVFALSWLVMYLIGKSRARKMNMDLQQWKAMQSEAEKKDPLE